MGVSYLGINLGTLEYIAILLFGLIIFVIILIATEKQRQRRHIKNNLKELHRKEIQKRMHQGLQHSILK